MSSSLATFHQICSYSARQSKTMMRALKLPLKEGLGSKVWRIARQIPGYALMVPYSLAVGLMIPMGLVLLWVDKDSGTSWIPADTDDASMVWDCAWSKPW